MCRFGCINFPVFPSKVCYTQVLFEWPLSKLGFLVEAWVLWPFLLELTSFQLCVTCILPMIRQISLYFWEMLTETSLYCFSSHTFPSLFPFKCSSLTLSTSLLGLVRLISPYTRSCLLICLFSACPSHTFPLSFGSSVPVSPCRDCQG